ncbi:MAG TPA: lasso peptide biosynthesis B2 protein [Pyrinomonadaceae bacterium]|jgi:hypothetical protein
MPVEHTPVRPSKPWIVRRAVHYIGRKPGEAFLLLRMAAWVAALSFLMKLLPLPRVLSLIADTGRKRKPLHPRMTQQRLAQLVDALLGMNVLCFTPTCWKRAPVLHRYLALYGIETRIIFGVRKEKETLLLAGHAWLEADGRPLLEASPPQYTTTYSFPA